jgi:hypothetical protein
MECRPLWLDMTAREKADLIAFMETLSGEVPRSALPEKLSQR